MRTYAEYKQILTLWEAGHSKRQIAVATDIPRRTVLDCIQRFGDLGGLEAQIHRARKGSADVILTSIWNEENIEIQHAYAYLLGLYLGDGYIVRMRRVHRLRVALDKKYPAIIDSCVKAIQTLLPENAVAVVDCDSYVHVSCYHKFWPEIIPQYGDGPKHERPIKLEQWQQVIIDRYPLEFFRGLYHSDGSRDNNVVKGKSYPRYGFRNFSTEILQLYSETCNRLGLRWTLANKGTSVNIARRDDVAYLDREIGPKT